MLLYSYMYKECHFYLKKERNLVFVWYQARLLFFFLEKKKRRIVKDDDSESCRRPDFSLRATFSSSKGFEKIKKEILILRTLSIAPLFIYRLRLDVKK